MHKQKIASHTYHLKLKLASGFANYLPGQQLRVFVGLDNPLNVNDLLRTYSVWHYNPATLEADLAVCTFSKGKGAAWAEKIQTGETVYFSGPKGRFVFDRSAAAYLFLGDISALAPLYELARQVEPGQSFRGFVYSADESDFFMDGFSGNQFKFIKAVDYQSCTIIQELNGLQLPATNTITYIAGEAAFCKDLHDYFHKTLCWDARQIKAKPFWHSNKKGLE
ncbi:MAG: siderophore-interacting protein [Cytophagales bacterium]|nr:siderophore-interacting protein [Cytophagales bacterium]